MSFQYLAYEQKTKLIFKKCEFEIGDLISFYTFEGDILNGKIISIEKILFKKKNIFIFHLENQDDIYPCFVIENFSKKIKFFDFEKPIFQQGQNIIFKNKKGIVLQLSEINLRSHKKYYDIKTNKFYYRIPEKDLISADSP